MISGKGDSNLTKIAEVAGKRIKKLRRNWSLKKEDISKGLLKIKKNSKTLIEDVYSREGDQSKNVNISYPYLIVLLSVKFSSVGRRKISLSQLLSTDNPELKNPNTTFYVGLKEANASSINQPPNEASTVSSSNQASNIYFGKFTDRSISDSPHKPCESSKPRSYHK